MMSTTFLSERMTKYFEESWIEKELPKLSDKRYHFIETRQCGVPRSGFWNIILKGNKWAKFSCFHFELRWDEHKYFTDANEIRINVHLESKEPKSFFEKRGCTFGGEGAPNTIKEVNGMKLDASVIPDFSSEEKAIETVRRIIAALDSPAYQQCAEIADAYLRQMKKGK